MGTRESSVNVAELKGYLLDTNVISETLKKNPSERVLARLRMVPREHLFTSSV